MPLDREAGTLTDADAWALVMGVEKWIERWMTHYHVPADMRDDVRHGVMIDLFNRSDRWKPELGNWMTFCTPWIRAFVQQRRRECERELGNVNLSLRLPYRVSDYDFDADRSDARSQERELIDAAREQRVSYARLRLTHRERVVIALLESGAMVKTIGEHLGISRERARQIKNRAIAKMQKHVDSDGERGGDELNRDRPTMAGAGTCNSGRDRGMVRGRVPEFQP